jgi:predicted  nucleic acid-binding Zn-ribbon protein
MPDDSAPATKNDIAMLMDEIGKLYDANEKWKDEILEANEKWKDELKKHFDVIAENIHHDMLKGALNDKVEQHEDRIQNLEQHTGLIAA